MIICNLHRVDCPSMSFTWSGEDNLYFYQWDEQLKIPRFENASFHACIRLVGEFQVERAKCLFYQLSELHYIPCMNILFSYKNIPDPNIFVSDIPKIRFQIHYSPLCYFSILWVGHWKKKERKKRKNIWLSVKRDQEHLICFYFKEYSCYGNNQTMKLNMLKYLKIIK